MAIAGYFCEEEDKKTVLYRRLNVSIMAVAILISLLCYYVVAQFYVVENIKWCCAMKGGAIAIALHAVYAQLFEVPKTN